SSAKSSSSSPLPLAPANQRYAAYLIGWAQGAGPCECVRLPHPHGPAPCAQPRVNAPASHIRTALRLVPSVASDLRGSIPHRFPVHRHPHQAPPILPILQRMNDDLDVIPGLERIAPPPLPAEPIRAAALDGPLHHLPGRRVLHQNLHPDVRVGPLNLLDRA